MMFIPLFVSADIASTTLSVPVHISPVDNSALTTALFTSVDWTDTFVGTSTTPALYYYELSSSTSTNVDGGFTTSIATSSLLASSTMITVGTPEGAYYWHVRSADAFGNKGAWSTPWKVVIDNTLPTAPSNLVITASSAPVIVGTTTVSHGSQTWSFSPSIDNGSGVAKYQYAISGTSSWLDNGLFTSFNTALGVGSHTVSVRALDRSGNISTSTRVLLTVTASGAVATTTPFITPLTINQCKRGGWRTFTSPSFKNQGKCVSFVEKMLRDKKKAQRQSESDIKKRYEEYRKMLKRFEDDSKKNVAKVVEKAHAEKWNSSSSTWSFSEKRDDREDNNEYENRGRGNSKNSDNKSNKKDH